MDSQKRDIPKLFRVILPVNNVDEAASFYENLLSLKGKRVSSGRHYFDCNGTILACFDPRADGDDFDLKPNPDHLYFSVNESNNLNEYLVTGINDESYLKYDNFDRFKEWGLSLKPSDVKDKRISERGLRNFKQKIRY
ncbi:MAG: hypothetical protein B2I17_01655 [Thermoplasmatales archaeon B_DKE]|nr:MAG: hypothetical protein B2I17_01655 [Thermoplasmatales archaeon B_DKE]